MINLQHDFVNGRAEEAPAAPVLPGREFVLDESQRQQMLNALLGRVRKCAQKVRDCDHAGDAQMAVYWRHELNGTRDALRAFELYFYGRSHLA